jgi:hypothetical protein
MLVPTQDPQPTPIGLQLELGGSGNVQIRRELGLGSLDSTSTRLRHLYAVFMRVLESPEEMVPKLNDAFIRSVPCSPASRPYLRRPGGTFPGVVVLLGHSNAGMAEQHTHLFEGCPCIQEGYRKGIPEPMGMAVLDAEAGESHHENEALTHRSVLHISQS